MGAFLILFAALIATDRVADIADFLLGALDWSATLK